MLLWVAVEEVLGAAVADQHSGNKPHETRKNQKTTPSGEWMGMGHKLEFPMGEFLRPF